MKRQELLEDKLKELDAVFDLIIESKEDISYHEEQIKSEFLKIKAFEILKDKLSDSFKNI